MSGGRSSPHKGGGSTERDRIISERTSRHFGNSLNGDGIKRGEKSLENKSRRGSLATVKGHHARSLIDGSAS
jgi:hypothetical protein